MWWFVGVEWAAAARYPSTVGFVRRHSPTTRRPPPPARSSFVAAGQVNAPPPREDRGRHLEIRPATALAVPLPPSVSARRPRAPPPTTVLTCCLVRRQGSASGMKAGRKNLQRACQDGTAVTLAEGDIIMQVVTLRGSNLIEVMDCKGIKSLALFPAKFQKIFWIKNGNFVVVDASGRDEALKSGSKIGCVVSRVLFHDQVRALEKSGEWPAIFKSTPNGWATGTEGTTTQVEEEPDSDEEDDGLPPLEANTNRDRPFDVLSDSESGSDSTQD